MAKHYSEAEGCFLAAHVEHNSLRIHPCACEVCPAGDGIEHNATVDKVSYVMGKKLGCIKEQTAGNRNVSRVVYEHEVKKRATQTANCESMSRERHTTMDTGCARQRFSSPQT